MTTQGAQASPSEDGTSQPFEPEGHSPSTSQPSESEGQPEAISPPVEEAAPANPDAPIQISLKIPKGTRIRLTVESLPAPGDSSADPGHATLLNQIFQSNGRAIEISLPAVAPARTNPDSLGAAQGPIFTAGGSLTKLRTRLRSAVQAWPYSLAGTLFGLAVLIYTLTRLIGLADFPIYFFTDEAVQTVLASDFVRDGFRNEDSVLLPTYFKNGKQYNLSLSVYLQVVPYLLFGKSVVVTRAVSVAVSLLAVIAVALALRDIFKVPYWWSGAMFLAITPAWFLHSRTAFETVESIAFYAGFFYLYLLYRDRSTGYVYPALLLGAMAFYTYSPAQLVMVLSGLLLLASDWRYHWQNRQTALRSLGLLALLALPYLRFVIAFPQENLAHLKQLHSYWLEALPLTEKLGRYFSEYLYGLNPKYWFLPNNNDLARHLMQGYGHILIITLPLILIGLFQLTRRIHLSAYRALLIALLVAPSGAALVEVGITRALFFVVPAALLTALGMSACLECLERRGLARNLLAVGLFGLLSLSNLAMARDALANGPTWYQDYGLGGMQYGARQVFSEVRDILRQAPHTQIVVSPNWANGADILARFFLPDPLPVSMGSVEAYLFQRLPLDDHTLLVMIPEEYQKALNSWKLTSVQVDRVLYYPNGQPGFYFVHMDYADKVDEVFAAEQRARQRPLEEQVAIDGQMVTVKYPYLDMGEIWEAFDSDPSTLIRTLEANPLVLRFEFPTARSLSGLIVLVGGTPTSLSVRVYRPESEEALAYEGQAGDSPKPRYLTVDFSRSILTNHVEILVENINEGEPGHVHLWEVNFNWSQEE